MEAKIRNGLVKSIVDNPDGSVTVSHIVSVFGNKDHVGDVVYAGAFAQTLQRLKAATANGRPMAAFYSHNMSDPNMCVGTVLGAEEVLPGDPRLDGVEGDAGKNGGLLADIKYDTTPTAQRVVQMIKDGRLTQSSFTYDVIDGEWVSEEKAKQLGDPNGSHYALKQLDLLELGPTPLGCNDQTTVVGVKERQAAAKREAPRDDKGAIPLSAGPAKCEDGAWDGSKEKAGIPADATPEQLAAFFAWRDPEGDASAKDSYRFIHHTVGDDGKAAAANLKACQTGIGVLNGGRGGTTIPDADVKGVYEHLAAHIREAGQEPPELNSGDGKDRTYKAGRALSGKNEADLRQAADLLQGVLSSVEATDDSGKADGGAESGGAGGSKDNGTGGSRPTETKAADQLSMELELLELGIDN